MFEIPLTTEDHDPFSLVHSLQEINRRVENLLADPKIALLTQ